MNTEVLHIGIAFFVGVVSAFSFKKIVHCFAKHDESQLEMNFKSFLLHLALIIALSLGLLWRFHFTVIYGFMMYLFLYLYISAYIDYKIKMVYTVLNFFAGVIGVLFLIYTFFTHVNRMIDWFSILIFLTVMCLSKKLKLFGGGDFELFLVEVIYIYALPVVLFPIQKMLFIMALSILLQFVLHYKEIDFFNHRLQLKEPVELIPAILISSVINLLVIL